MTHYNTFFPLVGGRLSGHARLKVEDFHQSFFQGRQFRTFLELNIPGNTTQVVRIQTLVPTILHGQEFVIEGGHLRVAILAGGTPGGTFSTALPIIAVNNMPVGPDWKQEAYVPVNLAHTGGTHTGGTEIEVVRVKADASTARATTTGASLNDERGVAATTTYLRLQALTADAVVGVFRLRWEERPAA